MPSSTTETYEVVGSRHSARSRFATASCAAFSASSVRRKGMNKRSPLCPSRENAALGSSLLCSIEPKRRTASSAAAEEAVRLLGSMAQSKEEPSAAFSLLGHKGDLLFIPFRRTLQALNRAQGAVRALSLAP